MTVPQVKRVWRNKKTHVREILLREKRYREGTGGGLDLELEKSISRASASFTEAEAELARTLGGQAVMAGLGKFETFIDKESGSSNESIGNMDGRRVGGRDHSWQEWVGGRDGGKPTHRRREQSICEVSDSSLEEGEIGRSGRRVGGRAPYSKEEEGGREGGQLSPPVITPDELEEIRRKKVLRQLSDFDSDSSSPPEKRRRSETEVCRLQMELLKEERAIFTKISSAMDKLVLLLDHQLELTKCLLEKIDGRKNGSTCGTKPSWDPVDGDPNLALSHKSLSFS